MIYSLVGKNIATCTLHNVYMLLLTEVCVVDLGSGLRWGNPLSQICDH